MPDFRRTAKTLNFSHLPDGVTPVPNLRGYSVCPAFLREKILAEIPDVPIKLDPNSSSTINTMTVSFMYTHPTNPDGYRMVARNLRDLAFAYKAKITATPLPEQ
jgi:hypothetical protein